VINETIDPTESPKPLKALPAHSAPAAASSPAPAKKSHSNPASMEIRKAVPVNAGKAKDKRNGQ
jgi:hypothetical protein